MEAAFDLAANMIRTRNSTDHHLITHSSLQTVIDSLVSLCAMRVHASLISDCALY